MKIVQLVLQTNQLLATKLFYQDVLGLEVVDETAMHIVFRIGDSQLVFELVHSEHTPKYHFAFTIPLNQMEAAADWVAARTTPIRIDDNGYIAHFKDWKARAVYFFDNNANILELICRDDLHNAAEDDFTAAFILSISEIGLVVDQPLVTGDELNHTIHTDFFSKGPKREDFTAVGDDDGLFVIAIPGRNWYPTQQPSEKWKVKATVRVHEKEYTLVFNG
ncbi:MAG: VOC family protein [Bacteroidetes bacterium]|nr:VOC family protein [Bacteroidota bacterium]